MTDALQRASTRASGATKPLLAGVPAAGARVLCVVIHGRHGAPETMMAELVLHLSAPGVHFVLPRAAGASWYDAPSCGALTDRTLDQVRAGIVQVTRDIDRALGEGAPGDRIVIGGFSQGACMALECAVAGRRRPSAAFALTGCRVGRAGDARAAAELAGMPVYLGNGAADPFIALPEFAATLCELAAAGARVRCDLFPRDAHVMSPPEIGTVDAMLRAVAGGAPPFAEGAG